MEGVLAIQKLQSVEESQKLLLRVSEAANQLSLSKSYLYRLVCEGVIPSVRIGNAVRISHDVVQDIAMNGTGKYTSREWAGREVMKVDGR